MTISTNKNAAIDCTIGLDSGFALQVRAEVDRPTALGRHIATLTDTDQVDVLFGWAEGRRIIMPGDTLTLCRKVQGRKPGEPLASDSFLLMQWVQDQVREFVEALHLYLCGDAP